MFVFFFFCKQKTAYDMRIGDWSSDVCSSDLKVMQAGSGDAGGLAELHRLDFTGRDQLVELGAADADHAGSVVDANADRLRGSSRLPGAALSLSSARKPAGSEPQRLTADSFTPALWMMNDPRRGQVT